MKGYTYDMSHRLYSIFCVYTPQGSTKKSAQYGYHHLFRILKSIAEQVLPRSLPMVAYLNLERIDGSLTQKRKKYKSYLLE